MSEIKNPPKHLYVAQEAFGDMQRAGVPGGKKSAIVRHMGSMGKK